MTDESGPFRSSQFREAFDAVPDAIVVVDGGGVICEANLQVEGLFGYQRDELVGRQVEVLVPQALRDLHRAHRAGYSSERYVRPMGASMELQGRRKDGSLFPAEISLSPLDLEDTTYVMASVRDVTARLRLKRFSDSTLRATEEERLRVAQELHDDTAQQLSALMLKLRVARATVDATEREGLFDQLREDMQHCAEGVRRIARGLRPPALQDAGLAAAVRAHVAALAVTGDLAIEVDADAVDTVLAPDARLVLYRVIQEALTNVVRHSGARTARVRIRNEGYGVAALIEDDGVGFDRQNLGNPDRGLGLVGMEERAQSVGGHVELDSATGRGTRVRVTVPTKLEALTHG